MCVSVSLDLVLWFNCENILRYCFRNTVAVAALPKVLTAVSQLLPANQTIDRQAEKRQGFRSSSVNSRYFGLSGSQMGPKPHHTPKAIHLVVVVAERSYPLYIYSKKVGRRIRTTSKRNLNHPLASTRCSASSCVGFFVHVAMNK